MSSDTRRMQRALHVLNALVKEGVEYPDAEYRAATRMHVDHTELRAAYDAQFDKGRG